ncbi:hypothetical protein KAN5_01560 [Pseudoalteromonas sp. KAN5]|nr:hypothetical protein KAN5_01560 [Pseudoalteromonas sp. KAN5]
MYASVFYRVLYSIAVITVRYIAQVISIMGVVTFDYDLMGAQIQGTSYDNCYYLYGSDL